MANLLRSRLVLVSALAIVWLGLAIWLQAGSGGVGAHEEHACPDDYPDTPVLDGHIDQADIDSGDIEFEELVISGRELFNAVFNACDGQGRPATTGGGDHRDPGTNPPAFIRTSAPDSSACAGCHNQPRSGGGGDFVANVFVLAQTLDPVTESVSSEFSNERNTVGMFGAGAIEMLGREMTADLHAIRDEAKDEAEESGESVTVELVTKGVSFGQITADPDGTLDMSEIAGIDDDLVVKPFHQAGVVRSIREFTVNAYNHHHGMQADERFDLNPDKGVDYDEDGIAHELTIGDITAATIYQAQLGTPGRLMPEDEDEREWVGMGEVVFGEIGCESCHSSSLELDSATFTEPYLLNPPGTWNEPDEVFSFDMTSEGEGPYLVSNDNGGAIVNAYTDLKRHHMCDPEDHPDPIRFFCNETLAQTRPDQDGLPGSEFFITRKLWDVGNSAPYGHRGDLTSITEAILAHGGEARESRDQFAALPMEEQQQVVAFLKTLQVLPAGSDLVEIEGQQPAGTTRRRDWILPAVLIAGIGVAFLCGYGLQWRRESA